MMLVGKRVHWYKNADLFLCMDFWVGRLWSYGSGMEANTAMPGIKPNLGARIK